MEIWKDIYFIENDILYDYRGLYQISSYGNVKSLRLKKQILKKEVDCRGYERVCLSKKYKKKKFKVHRLVAYMFIENKDKEKTEINHKDENKLNNNVENLEWCTRKYNMNYGNMKEKQRNAKLGKERKKGKDNPKYDTGKKVIQYSKDDKLIKVWNSIKQAERNLQIYHIGECCQGKRSTSGGFIWKYFEEGK